jgi:predicted XRE-type DNA-binding protein
MINHTDHANSSGNVFADLGVANPEEANTKADLAIQINRIIDRRGLTQIEAARLLGINQPKVSALMRGKLTGFSIERLLRFLARLGNDVHIVISPAETASEGGHVHVLPPPDDTMNVSQRRDSCVHELTGSEPMQSDVSGLSAQEVRTRAWTIEHSEKS